MPTYTISSTGTSHYTEALTEGQAETETFPALRGDGQGDIDTVNVRSKEKLAWQVEVLDKDSNVVHKHAFTTDDAIEKEISEVTYYFYTESNLGWNIPLTIPKTTVDVSLRNMSSAAKTAGTAGEAIIELQLCK